MLSRTGLTTLIITLMLLTALGWAIWPTAVQVSAEPVRSGTFVVTVADEGITRLRSNYPIVAPIAGTLQRVEPEPGDVVTAGAPLFQLTASAVPSLDAQALARAKQAVTHAEAVVAAAAADVSLQETQLTLARRELARQQHLHDRKLLTAAALERFRAFQSASEAALTRAQHQHAAARAELAAAQAVVAIEPGRNSAQPLTVTAPITGTVLSRERCCEGPIAAGNTVLTLGRMQDLEVQVDLLSSDAVRIREGMTVTLERWGGEETLKGHVRRVEPEGFTRVSALGIEEQRVPVWVTFDSAPEQRPELGVGFRVEARFQLQHLEQALQVPSRALWKQGDTWFVHRIEQGRARARAVETGLQSGLTTVITSGLQAGDHIITDAAEPLDDGRRVQVSPRY